MGIGMGVDTRVAMSAGKHRSGPRYKYRYGYIYGKSMGIGNSVVA